MEDVAIEEGITKNILYVQVLNCFVSVNDYVILLCGRGDINDISRKIYQNSIFSRGKLK